MKCFNLKFLFIESCIQELADPDKVNVESLAKADTLLKKYAKKEASKEREGNSGKYRKH